MSKYSNQIEYNITTKLDGSGLAKLQTQIKSVEDTLKRITNYDINDKLGFDESIRQLKELNKALSSSFNSSLGMLDIGKLKSQLQDAGVTAKGLGTAFANSGAQGKVAFNNLIGEIGKVDTGLKRTSTTVDKMFNTISNTVRWGIVSSGFSAMLDSFHKSVEYVKDLDDSLTQIMLVTDYSRQQMNEYAKSANEAAKALGATTTDVTRGTQVFAQQGYDLNQSGKLAELSIKLANASEQDSATTSDQITALMNAYNLSGNMDELSKALDSWALVANVSAADVQELAKASQKAASTAATVDVSLEQLNAQIATIESVTKEAPEQIGNGLKTLYARFSDLEMGETLEDGVTLGKVTSQLQAIGVEVLDEFGKMRGVGDIIEDMMEVWSDLDTTQKAAVAQTVAGKYQLGRFEALMNSPEMYDQYAKASISAEGTLDQMNEEYLESLKGKSAKLQATLEGIFNSLFNTDNFYPAIDALTTFLDLLNKLIDSLGGGATILTGLVSVTTKLFSNNIAQQINDANMNRQLMAQRQKNAENAPALLDWLGSINPDDEGSNAKILDFARDLQNNRNGFSKEQLDTGNKLLTDAVQAHNELVLAQQKLEDSSNAAAHAAALLYGPDGIGKAKEDLPAVQELLQNVKLTAKEQELAKERSKQINDIKNTLTNANVHAQSAFKEGIDTEKAQIHVERYLNTIEQVQNGLLKLKESGALLDNEYDDLAMSIDKVLGQLSEIDPSSEKVEQSFREIVIEIQKLKEAFSTIARGDLDKALKGISLGQSDVDLHQAKADNADSMLEAFQDAGKDQAHIKSIIDTASAVGELTFAWQAFQNLGPLWSNKDLSIGEKLLQTIMNLSMVIPSVVNAWDKLKDAKKALEALNIIQASLNAKTAAAIPLNGGLSASNLLVAGSSKLAAAGVGLLKTALEKLTSVPVLAALAAIGVALNVLHAQFEEEKNNVNDLFEEYEKANEKANINTSSFDAAYKNYKKTGVASDELVNSSKELSKQLGISGGSALAASGQFDTLAESIKGAKQEADKMTDQNAETAYQVSNQTATTYHFFQRNDWAHEVSNTGAVQYLGLPGEQSDLDFTQQIGQVNKQIENTKKSIEFLEEKKATLQNTATAKLTAEDKGFLEAVDKLIKERQEQISKYQALLGREDATQHTGLIQERAQEKVDNLDPDSFQGETKASLREKFTDVEGEYKDIAREWVRLGGEAGTEAAEAYVDGIISAIEEGKTTVESMLSLDSPINGDNLTSAESKKSALEKLYDTYDKAEGEISADDAASMLAANPEYIEYLDKVGEHYVLNTRFLQDYNQSIRDQQQALDELQGDTIDLQAQDEVLIQLMTDSNDKYSQIYEKLFSLNTQMETGTINQEDFLSGINEALDTLGDSLDSTGEKWEDFAEKLSDEDTNAIQTIFDEIVKGLQLAGKQFKSGQKTVGQYGNELLKTARKAEEFARNVGDTESANKLSRALKEGAEEAVNFSNAITENFEDVTQVFDNNFQVLDSAKTELGGVAEEYRNTIQTMVESAQGFYQSNPQAAREMAAELHAIMGESAGTVSQIQQQLQSDAEGLTNSLMGSAAATGVFMQDTTSQTQQAISNMAQGISMIIQGIMTTITSMHGEVHGTAAPEGELVQEWSYTDDKGNKVTGGQAHIPGFAVTVSGSGSASGSNISSNSYANQQAEQNALHHYNSTGETTTPNYRPGTINSQQNTGQKMIEQGSKLFAEGLAGLTTLDQYAPNNSNNGNRGIAPTRNDGTGGGGGKGGSCFVAGTLITMQGYRKKIEDVKVGDIVLSYNRKTKQNECSKVLQTMTHNVKEKIYTLHIEKESLRVTGIHRFFVKRKNRQRWIEAQYLKVGDLVFFADKTWHKILDIEFVIESKLVYNFEVSRNHNYYVGINRILAHNKGRDSGKGNDGGGKTYEPKHKDPIEEKKDLYEKVNTHLDKISENLKDIERNENRLIGTAARGNLGKKIDLLKEEASWQAKKLKIQKEELATLGERLKKDYGIKIDDQGFISNYAKVFDKLQKKINDLTEQYNKATTESEQERLEKEIESAKKVYDSFKEDYKRYDALQGKEIKETENALEDLEDEIEDVRIDIYKASQEAIDNIKDIREEYTKLIGLWSGHKSDSPFRKAIEDAERLKTYFGGTHEDSINFYQNLITRTQEEFDNATDFATKSAAQSRMQFFQQKLDQVKADPNKRVGAIALEEDMMADLQRWMDNPDAADNPFGKNTAALFEQYQLTFKQLSEDLLKASEIYEDSINDVIEISDEIMDKQEYQLDRYEHVIGKLEKMEDMLSLVAGDDEFQAIAELSAREAETLQAELNMQKEFVNTWREQYEKVKGVDEDMEKALRIHLEDAEDKMLELQQKVIEAYKKEFENASKEIIAQMNQALLGSRNIDDISTDWERDREYASKYLDDVQKQNAIQQLRLKYMSLLDDAAGSSLQIQRRIRDAMEEQTKYLQDQTYLSEFNVKYANAQLEILQKQIALEDARQNKNQMKLRRDTQGNYRYVYSADQNDIRDKEADLLQEEMDAYNMSNENRMSVMSDALNYYKNYTEQYLALQQRIAEGDKEAEAALEKLQADFKRDMAAYAEELDDSVKGMMGSLEWMQKSGVDIIVATATQALEALESQNEDTIEELGIQWDTALNDFTINFENTATEVEKANSKMINQVSKFKDKVELYIGDKTKTAYDKVTDSINEASTATDNLATSTSNLLDILEKDNAALEEAKKKVEEYASAAAEAANENSNTSQMLQRAQTDIQSWQARELDYKSALGGNFHVGQKFKLPKGTVLYYGRNGGQKDSKGGKSYVLPEDTAMEVVVTDAMASPYSNDPSGPQAKYSIGLYYENQTPMKDKDGDKPEDRRKQVLWLDKTGIAAVARFDTGGYTGDWGEEGKIATLHEKELVLNKTDTSNILTAVKMIRELVSFSSMTTNLSTLLKKFTNKNSSSLGGDTIEQRVEITAEFPNASSANEIKQALLSLADSAYQYSFRER